MSTVDARIIDFITNGGEIRSDQIQKLDNVQYEKTNDYIECTMPTSSIQSRLILQLSEKATNKIHRWILVLFNHEFPDSLPSDPNIFHGQFYLLNGDYGSSREFPVVVYKIDNERCKFRIIIDSHYMEFFKDVDIYQETDYLGLSSLIICSVNTMSYLLPLLPLSIRLSIIDRMERLEARVAALENA